MRKIVNTKKIEKFRINHKLTKKAFCKKCEISVSRYYKILSGNINFYIDALFKIAIVMDIEVYKLLN